MNWFFLIGGGLSLIASCVHMWGGESTLRRTPTTAFPTIPNGDSHVAKQEIRFGWHMASVDMFISGLVLVGLALMPSIASAKVIARLLALYFVGYGLIIAILPLTALRRLKTLIQMPQWLLTFTIAALAWWGAR